MRVVIQRVQRCSVAVDGNIIGEIGKGLAILLGIEDADTQEDIDWLCGKVSRLRIFDDYHGRTPFLLTGGIGPCDADKMLSFSHPMMAGIDLNSKFESAPAMKDVKMLKDFTERLRQG